MSGFLTSAAAFLVVLTVLVFVHEFGHYVVARLRGVRVEVFSIGFGRELWGMNDGRGTRWRFSAIPLGGYVRLYGEDEGAHAMSRGETKVAWPRDSYPAQPPQARVAILAAGPVANMLFAFFALLFLFMAYGEPVIPPVIDKVLEGSAAEEAGLKDGDRILAVNGNAITTFDGIREHSRSRAEGEALALRLLREDETFEVVVLPRPLDGATGDNPPSMLGIASVASEFHPLPAGEALRSAWAMTVEITVAIGSAVADMFLGRRALDELGGPLRIAELSGVVSERGAAALIHFMALISVNLALLNLLPLPPLDGGGIVLASLEGLRGRALKPKVQVAGTMIGMAFLLLLFLIVTWNDVSRLLSG